MELDDSRIPLTPIVFTMGKVASSSVSLALLEAGLACHDIHTLNPEVLRKTAQDWLSRDQFPPQHICLSMAHREQLMVKQARCLYISLVRDPIARNLSAFFQNLDFNELDQEERAAVLFENFLNSYPHTVPISFFDREYRGQLNINIYRKPFDKEALYSFDPVHNTVIFRIDCPDEVKSEVLSDLLGTKIVVGRENDGDNKYYKDRYDAVKELARFSPEFTEDIYSSKFCKHFWTDEECDAMRQRWTLTT